MLVLERDLWLLLMILLQVYANASDISHCVNQKVSAVVAVVFHFCFFCFIRLVLLLFSHAVLCSFVLAVAFVVEDVVTSVRKRKRVRYITLCEPEG